MSATRVIQSSALALVLLAQPAGAQNYIHGVLAKLAINDCMFSVSQGGAFHACMFRAGYTFCSNCRVLRIGGYSCDRVPGSTTSAPCWIEDTAQLADMLQKAQAAVHRVAPQRMRILDPMGHDAVEGPGFDLPPAPRALGRGGRGVMGGMAQAGADAVQQAGGPPPPPQLTSVQQNAPRPITPGDSPANVQAHNYVNPPTGGPRVRLQGGLPEEIKTADVIGASSLPWGGAREIWPRNQANMTLPQTGPQPNPITGGHRTLPTR